jgi:hypothetical protein
VGLAEVGQNEKIAYAAVWEPADDRVELVAVVADGQTSYLTLWLVA